MFENSNNEFLVKGIRSPKSGNTAVIIQQFKIIDGALEFIENKQGNPIFIGNTTSANHAEFAALIKALNYAMDHQIKNPIFYSSNMTVVRQLQGEFKVKSEDIKKLLRTTNTLIEEQSKSGNGAVAIIYVPKHASDGVTLIRKALDSLRFEFEPLLD